jgi:hypothetical protein
VAKESQRGWKKYIPSLATIGKVFVAIVVIKIVNSYVVRQIPQVANSAQFWTFWPSV